MEKEARACDHAAVLDWFTYTLLFPFAIFIVINIQKRLYFILHWFLYECDYIFYYLVFVYLCLQISSESQRAFHVKIITFTTLFITA